MKIKFKKLFRFEGEELDGLDIDLDSVSGNDLEEAQRLVVVEKKSVTNMPEMNRAYCAQVAALASKKPVELIRSLPAVDYIAVVVEVQNFLLNGVS